MSAPLFFLVAHRHVVHGGLPTPVTALITLAVVLILVVGGPRAQVLRRAWGRGPKQTGSDEQYRDVGPS